MFLNTTGNVLDDRGPRRAARFLRRGGGWVGIHSAADTEYDWAFYTRILAGAWFLCHPLQQPGTIVREAAKHRVDPAPAGALADPVEEFYSFKRNPRPRARVLLSIDESTYPQDPNTRDLPTQERRIPEGVTGVMGDHPMAGRTGSATGGLVHRARPRDRHVRRPGVPQHLPAVC